MSLQKMLSPSTTNVEYSWSVKELFGNYSPLFLDAKENLVSTRVGEKRITTFTRTRLVTIFL